MLVAKGARIDGRDRYGRTPLHMASQKGHTAVIRFLLEKGADMQVRDDEGMTPLEKAMVFNRKTVIELLGRFEKAGIKSER